MIFERPVIGTLRRPMGLPVLIDQLRSDDKTINTDENSDDSEKESKESANMNIPEVDF